jgi:hypothetical protein
MNFVVNFSNNLTITYDLIDDPIVDIWKDEVTKYTISDCDKINHYCGCSSKSLIEQRIDRLYELANLINNYVENKIEIVSINKDNYRQSLATMHVHFPELQLDDKFKHLHIYLSEYNNIIHWLEGVMYVLFADNPENYSNVFTINLDFNKASNISFLEIPEDSFNLFNPYINFGDLHLSYVHVGRHAQELFSSNDLVCPKNQFVPQTKFTASAMMYFTDYFHATDAARQSFLSAWAKFYTERGGIDFWGYELNDPKLAFGSVKIGEISAITIDGQNIVLPKQQPELNQFRKTLANTTVLGWIIE